MRKVLIVNHLDAGGGAERFARLVLEGFTAMGTDARLVVGRRAEADPRVVEIDEPRRGPVRAARGAAMQAAGLEDYDFPGSHRLLELTGPPAPDAIVVANLHGGYFDLRILPEVSRKVPVVLRLPDSWLFTGHCATPLGCDRWEHGCGNCCDLTIPPAVERDATRVNWRRKRAIAARSRLYAAPPSRWQLDRARRSLLGPAIAGSRVVPDGVDLDTFHPDGPAADREALGVPPGAALLVFACNLGARNRYKDLATLRAAVAELTAERPVELLVIGGMAPLERPRPHVRIRHLPYVEDPRALAGLYRAADLYVHASWEETFCLTVAEALACATPVAAAATGGIAEVIDEGKTGHLVPPESPRELSAAIAGLLADPTRRRRMGAAGALAARERFDSRRMVADLHAFCAEAAATG